MIVLGGILARFITVGIAGVGAFAMMTYRSVTIGYETRRSSGD